MGGTYGIARVKDEADIIEATVRHMLAEVDRVIVVDNASTDGTRDILADLHREHPAELLIDDDPDVGYWQAQKMTALAGDAGGLGARWVVPFDADEIWVSPHGRIADALATVPQACIATADLYDHVATGHDPAGFDPIRRIGWRRRKPGPLPKVAAQVYPRVRIHQGNHDCDFGDRVPGLLVVHHFPYRSVEQMIRKARNGAAAYAATDLPEDVGKHWRDYGRLTDDQIGDVFRTHFWSADPVRARDLVFDPVA